jgi:hypothetical protein
LHNKEGILELISRINGKIRHSARLKQLESVCLKLNIPIAYPSVLDENNG